MSNGGNCISVATTSSPRFLISASVSSAKAARVAPNRPPAPAATAIPPFNASRRVKASLSNCVIADLPLLTGLNPTLRAASFTPSSPCAQRLRCSGATYVDDPCSGVKYESARWARARRPGLGGAPTGGCSNGSDVHFYRLSGRRDACAAKQLRLKVRHDRGTAPAHLRRVSRTAAERARRAFPRRADELHRRRHERRGRPRLADQAACRPLARRRRADLRLWPARQSGVHGRARRMPAGRRARGRDRKLCRGRP